MDRSAADELRGPDGALTGPTCSLLAVRLPAAASDLAAGLRVVRSLTGGRELGDDDLVDQGNVDLHAEDRLRQLDRLSERLTFAVKNGKRRHAETFTFGTPPRPRGCLAAV